MMAGQGLSRDFLARKLRQNWMTRFPEPLPTKIPASTAATQQTKEVDDSLTNLNWLQNMNLMKMTSPAPPLSPPPDNGFSVFKRSMSYDPAALSSTAESNITYPDSIDQLDEAELLEFKTNPLAKPGYSYASLICMAMRDLNKSKVALTDIYEWVMENFIYYRMADPSWQNSIRHNLSLNKCFQKVPRRKDEPGKGGFWRFNPEYVNQHPELQHQRIIDDVSVPTGNSKRRRPILPNSHTNNRFHNQTMSYIPPPKRQRSLQVSDTSLYRPELADIAPFQYAPIQNTQFTAYEHQQSQALPVMSSAFFALAPGAGQQNYLQPQTNTALHPPTFTGEFVASGFHAPSHVYSGSHLHDKTSLMAPIAHQQGFPNSNHIPTGQSLENEIAVNSIISTSNQLPPLTRGVDFFNNHHRSQETFSHHNVLGDDPEASALLDDFLNGRDNCDSDDIAATDNNVPALDLTTQGDPLDLTIQGVSLKPPDWWSQSLNSSSGGQLMNPIKLESSSMSRVSLAPSPLLLEEDQQWVDEQLNLEELDTLLGLS